MSSKFKLCDVEFPDTLIKSMEVREDFKTIVMTIDAMSGGKNRLPGKRAYKRFKSGMVTNKTLEIVSEEVPSFTTPEIQDMEYILSYHPITGLVEYVTIILTSEIS